MSSKFISSEELEAQKKVREAEWAAAYARIGQEAPERKEVEYDPRSLYEKLQTQKIAKQEEYEEKTSIKNQFKPQLDDEEAEILNAQREEAAERRRKAEEEIRLAWEEQQRNIKASDAKILKTAAVAKSTKKEVVSTSVKSASKKQIVGSIKGVKLQKKKAPIDAVTKDKETG